MRILYCLGFLSSSVFMFYDHTVPDADVGLLPKWRLTLSLLGLTLAVPGIVLSKLDVTEVMAAGGSFASAIGCFVS